MHKRLLVPALCTMLVCGAMMAGGCGDTFSGDDCMETRTCARSSDAGAGGNFAGDANTGGMVEVNGGAAGVGSDAAASGHGGEAPVQACAAGYKTWFASAFSFPDGVIIGAADFPSMPWVKSGALRLDSGRLSGNGKATASQGLAFIPAGGRLRFRARFSDSQQRAGVALDAQEDGSGGIGVTVDSSGTLGLTQGEVSLAEVELGPLETGVDWFVQADFDPNSASVSISRLDYAPEERAEVAAELLAHAVPSSTGGLKMVAELASGSGVSPSVDDISFVRCGLEPPSYATRFADTFDRADSSSLGSAEVPDTSVWEKGPNGAASITAGALEIAALASVAAPQGAQLPLRGLRARVSFTTKDVGSWFSFYFNKPSREFSASDLGFWAWGGPKGVYVSVFAGDGASEALHPELKFDAGRTFYAELNVDSGLGLLTLREGSFSGPIVAVELETGLAATSGSLLVLETANGFPEMGTSVHDVLVETYSP